MDTTTKQLPRANLWKHMPRIAIISALFGACLFPLTQIWAGLTGHDAGVVVCAFFATMYAGVMYFDDGDKRFMSHRVRQIAMLIFTGAACVASRLATDLKAPFFGLLCALAFCLLFALCIGIAELSNELRKVFRREATF